ncbi:hypothetical protein J3A83DRAFT_18121 [Scleroderma citrinum]
MTLFAEAAPSNAYFHWLYQQQVIKYFRIAPISIWILEFFLTLADEVRLLNGSKKRWGITHVLYIPTRYFPLLGSLCATYNAIVTTRPKATCVALYRTAEIILYFGMVSAEGLLLIRTLALWNTQSMVRMLLIWLYLVVAIIMFVCSVISSTLKFQGICGETSASVATALATQLSRVTVGMFSSAAFFELGMLSPWQMINKTSHTLMLTGLHSTSKLITAVTQGNLVYALSLFVISVINITFFVLPLRDGWNGLFVTFQGTLHGVMASRILFGLQDAVSEGFSLQVFTQSGVEFAPVHASRARTDEF